MELEVTWPRVIRVWLAYLWRHALMIMLSYLVGGILGAIIGFFAGMFGASEMTIHVLVYLVVIPVGLGLSLFPLKWVLKKKFKEFKLVMIANEQPAVANQPISPNQT